MVCCFWNIESVKRRTLLSLLLLASLSLACLEGISLYKGVHQPLEQIELIHNPVQQEIRSNIMDALQSLEHHFKENKGQLSNPVVRYYYSQGDFGVAFTDTGVMYRLIGESSAIVTLKFEGANAVQPEGHQLYAHLSHYFHGNDPTQWVTGVRSYAQVVYPEVYDGIDLVYYFTAEGLKYDLVLQPGANPQAIRFRYEGIEELTLDAEGFLTAHTNGGSLRDQALYLYQDTPAGQQTVAGAFILYDATTFGFQITESYSSLYPLIVDPLVWSTLLGGSGDDYGWAIAVDSANNTYVTGHTDDAVTDFPTTPGAFNETHNGGRDVFVCKLSADGSNVLYSTFLGGSEWDLGSALVVDSANNAYVTGETYDGTTNFPTTPGAYDETHNGGRDVFVCKLSADGSNLLYSTFLGGSVTDIGKEIAVDSTNNVYVTGLADSTDFPTTSGAFNETHSGGGDTFVCKLSADGSSLLYSTFLGGSGFDSGLGIALDSANNAYVTGETYDGTTNFPTTPGAYDETHNGGSDVFVCKLSADGSNLLYSTFLGGSGTDYGWGIALNSANNAYVTGEARDATTDFPTTPGAYDETHNGGSDVFVCKLSADGSNLLYSTFLGGSDFDYGEEIAVNSANSVYITGWTTNAATDFPTTSGAIDETHNGGYDVFVCKLSADGSNLLYSTFLGGAEYDIGLALTMDSASNVYVTGYTGDAATDFPTTPGAIDETHNGAADAFVCKITLNPPTINLISPTNGSINHSGTTVDLSIDGVDGSVSHVLYNWDGTPNATLASPYDLTLPSGDGQHLLHVYANDTVGNWAVQTYVFTTDDTGATITLSVPYIHQTYDTPDDFDGTWACAPTSAVMVLAYYERLPADPIWVSYPSPGHYSDYGKYISREYVYNGYTFYNEHSEPTDCGIATGKGAWGYIWKDSSGEVITNLQEYLRLHDFTVSFTVQPTEAQARELVKEEIDNGRPLIARTYLTQGGHYVVIVGYEIDAEDNFWYKVNDPFGDYSYYHNSGTCWGCYIVADPAHGTPQCLQPVTYSYAQMKLGDSWERGLITIVPSTTTSSLSTTTSPSTSPSTILPSPTSGFLAAISVLGITIFSVIYMRRRRKHKTDKETS